MNGSTIALEANGVSIAFGGVRAVDDVSFQIPQGRLAALIGPNGAGKSTLFNLLTNLYIPNRGTVKYFGRDLTGTTGDEIAKLGLIRTFQTARVFPGMSVLENVMVGAHLRAKGVLWKQAVWWPSVRRTERATRQRAFELLEIIGLERQWNDSAISMALGSQKLIEIARALMASPQVLLLDEPAAGLNDAETAELARLLRAMNAAGVTILVVEHNMALVMDVAEEVLVLDAGRLIARGTPEQVRSDERVIHAYIGAKPEAIESRGEQGAG
jgi:branched-chain amino acid transport system ATP-binding protein